MQYVLQIRKYYIDNINMYVLLFSHRYLLHVNDKHNSLDNFQLLNYHYAITEETLLWK